jgi:hypothetical protein
MVDTLYLLRMKNNFRNILKKKEANSLAWILEVTFWNRMSLETNFWNVLRGVFVRKYVIEAKSISPSNVVQAHIYFRIHPLAHWHLACDTLDLLHEIHLVCCIITFVLSHVVPLTLVLSWKLYCSSSPINRSS